MSWQSEFPNWDGGELYIPKGWEDYSWHNDVCPRAMLRVESETRTVEFSLWQDYIDVEKENMTIWLDICFRYMLTDILYIITKRTT